MKKHLQKIKKNKGFVVLFSMLVSTLILLISSSIYTIVQKQVELAGYSKESQKAFYAADAALDCALFYDISDYITQSAFAPIPGNDNIDIQCGAGTSTVRLLSGIQTGGDSNVTTNPDDDGFHSFNYPYVFRYHGVQEESGDYIGSGCAYVLVEKKYDAAVEALVTTRITAAGFNSCIESSSGSGVYDQPDINNPSLLERRLSLRYKQPL